MKAEAIAAVMIHVPDWKVDSFDYAFKHLTNLGAVLYRGPMNIENGWRMCKLKDPFGNLLGLRGP